MMPKIAKIHEYQYNDLELFHPFSIKLSACKEKGLLNTNIVIFNPAPMNDSASDR